MRLSKIAQLGLGILLHSAAALAELSDDTLRRLPTPGSDFDIHTGALLAPILQPRVPGTAGSRAVLQHFLDFFAQELPAWRVELHNASWTTPVSGGAAVPFVNLVATRDPPWATAGEVGRLALAAHYDSLASPAGFVGAIDSAAPCAMLLHAARAVDAALTRKWAAMAADAAGPPLDAAAGVQILLLDGEEAFVSWSDADSLYGSRALAADWEAAANPARATYRSALSSITLFVLLDLLGAAAPVIPSYFPTTHWAYQRMAALEVRLRALRRFRSAAGDAAQRREGRLEEQRGGGRDEARAARQEEEEELFLPDAAKTQFRHSGIGDDHIPFMARGVEVLHLIPSHFPRVWHRIEDDGEHLDMATVEDWALLTTAFAADWLELEGFFPDAERPRAARDRRVVSKTEL